MEELEDEEMMCECCERREEGGGRSEHWAQIREDQRDGFKGNDAQIDGV